MEKIKAVLQLCGPRTTKQWVARQQLSRPELRRTNHDQNRQNTETTRVPRLLLFEKPADHHQADKLKSKGWFSRGILVMVRPGNHNFKLKKPRNNLSYFQTST